MVRLLIAIIVFGWVIFAITSCGPTVERHKVFITSEAQSCSVTEYETGALIECPDGSSATVGKVNESLLPITIVNDCTLNNRTVVDQDAEQRAPSNQDVNQNSKLKD